jgi:hypothetical protein
LRHLGGGTSHGQPIRERAEWSISSLRPATRRGGRLTRPAAAGGPPARLKHRPSGAGFFVERGGAAAAEIAGLGEDAGRRARAAFAVQLQPEIKRLGEPRAAALKGGASFAQAGPVNAPLTGPH